jgi:valyl-tRNA synthetase
MELLPEGSPAPGGAVSTICGAGTLYLPLGDLVDIAQETARAEKEHAALMKDLTALEGKLCNEGFLAKAPAAVVEAERQRLAAGREKALKLEARIKELKSIQ